MFNSGLLVCFSRSRWHLVVTEANKIPLVV
jgi:hypothetical protein